MAESKAHMHLVNLLYQKVSNLVPAQKVCLIEKDGPETGRSSYNVEGYYPDVFYWNDDLLVIGEAKTLNDFETHHSQKQISAYIDECRKFNGKSILILAVPWQLKITALNYFRRLKRKQKITIDKIIVVDEFGGEFEV